MSTMLKEVYDALKEAGASEEKASAAAIAVSVYQLDRERLATKADIAVLKEDIANLKEGIARLDKHLAVVEERSAGHFKLLHWMIGFNLALTAAVLAKLF